jgi:putative membrane protein insertion efficiency factor
LKRLASLLVLLPIRFYRYGISPFTPMSCRYLPTCSEYAAEAVLLHGPLKGGWLALRRLARCHPLGGHGYDPVPTCRAGQQGHRHAG